MLNVELGALKEELNDHVYCSPSYFGILCLLIFYRKNYIYDQFF